MRENVDPRGAPPRGPRSITSRLIAWLLGASLLVLATVVWQDASKTRAILERNAEAHTRTAAHGIVGNLRAVVRGVEEGARALAAAVQALRLDRNAVHELLKAFVGGNPAVYGATLAWEPDAFETGLEAFAPYYHRRGSGLAYRDLGAADYGYRDQAWYRSAVEGNRPEWSEPYFDEGGGEIEMVTYSFPVERAIDGKRQVAAVLTADVSLAWLRSRLEPLESRLGEGAEILVISSGGRFVSRPDRQRMLEEDVSQAVSSNKRIANIARRMTALEEGFERFVGTRDGELRWLNFVPIRETGWSVGVLFLESKVLAGARAKVQQAMLYALAGMGVLVIVIVALARRITRPLRDLARDAARIGTGDLDTPVAGSDLHTPVAGSDLHTPVAGSDLHTPHAGSDLHTPHAGSDLHTPHAGSDLRTPHAGSDLRTPHAGSGTGDEVDALAEALARMQSDLKRYIEQLARETAARTRIETELEAARRIQMAMLPRIPAEPTRLAACDIAATLVPAKEVGGDLYDFIALDDGRIAFAVGDVSGKGVPAALFMARTLTLFKLACRDDPDPGRVLTRLNAELERDNDACMFVTMLCAVLEPEAGRLRCASAGHNPPLMVDARSAEFVSVAGGTVLGVMPDIEYAVSEISLDPTRALLVYTDGVTEAIGPQRELYDEGRLLETAAAAPRGARRLVDAVLESVRQFAAGEEQADDITILAIRPVVGASLWDGLPGEVLALPSTLDALAQARTWLEQLCQRARLDAEVLDDVLLVCEEVLANIVHHAHGGNAAQRMELRAHATTTSVSLGFRDSGRPYDPLEAPEPDLSAPPEARAVGGLGVHLIKHLARRVDHAREGDHNVLVVLCGREDESC
jgi:sigma-B regulation protein RsbU (phosphoserine phosphatase)